MRMMYYSASNAGTLEERKSQCFYQESYLSQEKRKKVSVTSRKPLIGGVRDIQNDRISRVFFFFFNDRVIKIVVTG